MKTKSPHALPQEGFVRVAAVAHTLNISIGTVWRWSAAGKFPKPVKISGKVTGWPVAEVRAWIAAKSATTNQPASN
ncbi:helix-turn-helix transcriptional regulator [Aeromonas jandaei]|uniref:helix-turn-helix transcriptional regulator n=1 Tax=Aeromonas jandaei TaxID=650 RepID=UPI001ADD62AF|nr:AlpA family phage regulatory protein [Aeromonas jandaei]QTL95322.1 Prophage CP4-57 regulatory protein (AlpA) [Aeromonas jandaei]